MGVQSFSSVDLEEIFFVGCVCKGGVLKMLLKVTSPCVTKSQSCIHILKTELNQFPGLRQGCPAPLIPFSLIFAFFRGCDSAGVFKPGPSSQESAPVGLRDASQSENY